MSILRNLPSVMLLVSLARAVHFPRNVAISKDIDLQINSDIDYRLPTHAIPSYYTVKLVPNIVVGDFTFTGESSINITLKESATNVTLHAKDLAIDEKFTSLYVAKTVEILKPTKHAINDKTDFLILTFDYLEVGNYMLNLKYTGRLGDDLNGFYRSSYRNERGEEVWLATTQFEPTHARRAFPCFDEPAYKANFKISINHYENFTAVSNMPFKTIERDENNLAKRWTNFDVTPVMSTYLIAFVISDFKYLSSEDGKFRVWSKPNAIEKCRYAHYIGQKELRSLDEYTGIPYFSIISKMDNFAIPQFRAGAMENWGIVTYRESALLYDENVTTTNDKQGIATVISHEFAHQWFGNLVTPLWWDYTWLNEGFANYFQYYITDKVEDTWRLMDQFVIKNLQETAFIADDKENQHAMNGKVNSPSEISAFFDSITYSKAGCVIRMISHALTEKAFQQGTQAYLSKMKHDAANSDDLFEELVKAAVASTDLTDGELKKALDSWVTQPGYPVITVIRDYKAGSASITQHRFLTQKTKEPVESWFIPINYATQIDVNFEDTRSTHWLKSEVKKNTTISGIKDGWIILNKQQTGYYRVNYDWENWSRIAKHLNSSKYDEIHVVNRAQILDDSFHLAQAGELADHSVFLEISTYLKREVDYVPWNAAFRAFRVLDKALANTEEHALFKLYTRRLVEKLEKSVGYNETDRDDHATKFNRINAIEWACYVGSESCAAAAHLNLVKQVLGSGRISANLRNVVFCAGIRVANLTIWEKMFGLYEKSKDESERKAIFEALGCSTDTDILEYFLAKSIVAEFQISPDDTIKAVSVGSPSGIDIAFDFINKNLKTIIAINNGSESIPKMLNEIGSRMTTKAQLDKLHKFIAANKDMAEDLKNNAFVAATKNIEWIERNGAKIRSFLKGQKLVETPATENSSGASLPALGPVLLLASTASIVSRIH